MERNSIIEQGSKADIIKDAIDLLLKNQQQTNRVFNKKTGRYLLSGRDKAYQHAKESLQFENSLQELIADSKFEKLHNTGT